MSNEKVATINSKDASQTANLQAVDSKVAKVDGKVAKKKGTALKFDNTYQAVSFSAIEFKVAECVWWKKISDKNIANFLSIDMDKLPAIYESDKYKQSLFNHLCVQWDDLKSFDAWVQSFPNKIWVTLSQRFKFGKTNAGYATIKAMVAGARKHYQQIADGGKVKVMNQRDDVFKRQVGNNNRNGRIS